MVSHLNGVCNSPELREAHASQQAAVVAFGNRAGQSRVLFEALRSLQAQGGLDPTQERILTAELRDMELRGVGLEGEAQEAFNAASQELAELATAFGNRVLDATNAWTLRLSDPAEVEGLPESLKEQLAQAARDAGDGEATAAEGPWLLGLDMPRFGPFLKYSRRRDLREIAYKAHVSRASGKTDGNWPAIERILTLRREQAQRLGYGSWAEVSLAAKMAGSVADVEALLEDLRTAAYPVALQELEALRACAAREGRPRRRISSPGMSVSGRRCGARRPSISTARPCGPGSPCPGCSMGCSGSATACSASASTPPMGRRPSGIRTCASSASMTPAAASP